ncbi:MAG: hypothetical protein HY606_03900 [Planctomycetes bacterium]|nr:hypothetical protein [Planctomycetota bacterium]
MNEKILKNILVRLERLEKANFGSEKKNIPKNKLKKFEGPKGGILLLVAKEVFNRRRTVPEIKVELKKYGYDYRIQVVQTALNRLSQNKGPLTAFLEGGTKVYVKRK